MSQPTTHPLEAVLLAVARADPHPWDYRREALHADLDPRELDGLIELLWLEGLLTDADLPQGGRGVVLTQTGHEVLEDPEALQRLRAGEVLTPSQGALVRNSLRRPLTPYITRVLLVANLALFAFCVYQGQRNNALSAYLFGRAPDAVTRDRLLNQVFKPAGAASIPDVLRGDWWRLLSACFVHGGLLHIAFNMYALYAAGQFVERTWGHLRYLVIYLISGWAGSCTGLPYAPGVLVGASGALCGILAAHGVWIFLNGRHLPRAMARAGRRQILINAVLMTVISFLPGISGWGHLGGALAGAATGLVLHYQRFGSAPVRLLGLAALLPLAWYPYHYMYQVGPRMPIWKEAEGLVFSEEVIRPVNAAMREASDAFDVVEKVRGKNTERREPEELRSANAAIDQQLDELGRLIARLEKRKFRGEAEEDGRQKGLEYARAREEVFREAKRCLAEGKAWKGADKTKFGELIKQLGQKAKAWEEAVAVNFRDVVLRPVNEAMREASDAYRDVVKPVRDRPPDHREPEQLRSANAAIDQQLDELGRLIARLEERRFRTEAEESGRRKGLEYARVREQVFREAKRCLAEGKGWKDADEEKFGVLWERLGDTRKAWEEAARALQAVGQ